MRSVAQSRERSLAGFGPLQLSILLGKVLGFALLLAVASKLRLPVPGTPVPATLQTLAVILAGFYLGPWGGATSVAAYLAAGVAGAPVFAFGGGLLYMMGPTGGYLLGFLPAAWLAGYLGHRYHGLWRLFGAFSLSCLVIHLFGWAQLAALGGAGTAWQIGVVPFLAFDLLKALLAAVLVSRHKAGRPA